VALPVGGTPVDFAYAVHTEVGHHCIGARVNGRLVPLESTLENGDVVEVLTSKADGAGPSRDWLQFVKSPRARNKIKQWFSKERREEAIEAGKDSIAKTLRKQNLPLQRLMSHDSMTAVATDLLKSQQSSGALREHIVGIKDGGHYSVPVSNEAYGTTETPLQQSPDDPVTDQLYTTGFALLGLHEAAAATNDANLKSSSRLRNSGLKTRLVSSRILSRIES
jgi:(p)ppGpp synthase/HD superfamily hydrolase